MDIDLNLLSFMETINTIGLFSGGGGLDLGFSAAGFNIVCSSDIDGHSCRTLEINQNRVPFYSSHPVIKEDVSNLKAKDLIKLAKNKKIHFLIGGPPCQSFSVFGKRKGREDPRGNLVFEYARLISEIKPKGFLFENVAGLKTIHNGDLFKELIEVLSFGGDYKVSVHEYEVADYGIPQFRKRIFFIGERKGKKTIEPMPSNHCEPDSLFNRHTPYKTAGIALRDMPEPVIGWEGPVALNSHVMRTHSQLIVDRYNGLRHGERDHKTRINKLHPHRPSYTIIVGSDKGGGKGHVHPFAPREVTPRESARIQTFPDWWQFHGTGRHVIRQIGNAVPPLFAAQLAAYLAEHIFGVKNETSYDYFVNRLQLGFLANGNN